MERRFAAQPGYAKTYATSIEQYVNLGHARCVEAAELQGQSGRTWYLPHHGVDRNGKLRIVFDAAARFQGVALNDVLLKGPDLIEPQFGVLLSFRENNIAVSADNEKMFNQVSVLKNDRFLCRPIGSSRPPYI